MCDGDKDVICKYKSKCLSEGHKCSSCLNNTGIKDYYEPQPNPWYPSFVNSSWIDHTVTKRTGTG